MPSNPLEKRDSSQVSAGMPQPQKIAVIVLALFAILIFVFWVFQMHSQLASPFNIKDDTLAKNSTSSVAVDSRLLDTDSDGLSDYDEVNVYHTSPYLEDTDSDSIADGVEVKNGTDPNCPTGQKCNALPEAVATSSVTAVTPDFTAITTSTELNASGVDTTLLQNALNGQTDAASLRQILISSGIDKTILDSISDADLMKSYQDTLSNQNKQ